MLGQAADVVMRLDAGGRAVVGRFAFDHVRVQRALGQPLDVFDFGGGVLEYLDELAADGLALGFRVGDAGQTGEEPGFGIHVTQVQSQAALERVLHLLNFAVAQEAVVHENAGELRPNGPVEQRRGHRRIHAATQPADDAVVAHLFTDAVHGVGDEIPGVPRFGAAADSMHEITQDGHAVRGVLHLRVELETKPSPAVGDGGAIGVGSASQRGHTVGQPFDAVAVAHPDRNLAADAGQQPRVALVADQVGVAVLAHVAGNYGSAQLVDQRLHPVADAEHGQAGVDYPLLDGRRAGVVHAGRAAGQDDATSVQVRDCILRRRCRDDFGIYLQLPDASGDEVGVLRAKVDNDHGFRSVHAGHQTVANPRKFGVNSSIVGRLMRLPAALAMVKCRAHGHWTHG